MGGGALRREREGALHAGPPPLPPPSGRGCRWEGDTQAGGAGGGAGAPATSPTPAPPSSKAQGLLLAAGVPPGAPVSAGPEHSPGRQGADAPAASPPGAPSTARGLHSGSRGGAHSQRGPGFGALRPLLLRSLDSQEVALVSPRARRGACPAGPQRLAHAFPSSRVGTASSPCGALVLERRGSSLAPGRRCPSVAVCARVGGQARPDH